ncbi:tetratricopeptide repeat protein [Ramlibacter humi]|uniref:Uncharacterized protein n=1 Tax=Ramlibacter humi TaxID=2530451 RepID=A0A4Z0BCV5_9BURK|nr:tetratricopeptide repeat protein [Ramlibacter humi]TFY97072.1 hypothetical protein EZ216_19620 [Ramlibacter humi]
MNPNPSSAAATRLQRLAAYLKEDPANPALLADACEAAIACGEHQRAREYIQSAERLSLDPAEWTFRRARLAIAQRELPEAARLLEQLATESGPHPVLAHDLAYVRFLQGDAEACHAVLQPWLEQAAKLPDPQRRALQVLWLRAEHRLQHLEEALEWARRQDGAGTLDPVARGVASLIALDENELDLARRWAEAALLADPTQHETLVARGSVALADGDLPGAARWLQQALQGHPDDGRTWSALGFASLQAMKLPDAQAQLERAVTAMPEHIDSWHALAWARLLQGDRGAALAALREALKLDASHAGTHAALALVLALGGEREEAERHLSEAERLDPGHATSAYARAVLSGQAGDARSLQQLLLQARKPR